MRISLLGDLRRHCALSAH